MDKPVNNRAWFLVLPVLVGLFERTDAPLPLRRAAIVTVGQLSRKVNFADHASRIVHPLVRVLLMEQLYRAMTIIHHHPYHRGDYF